MLFVHLITIWTEETLPLIRGKNLIVKMKKKIDRLICDLWSIMELIASQINWSGLWRYYRKHFNMQYLDMVNNWLVPGNNGSKRALQYLWIIFFLVKNLIMTRTTKTEPNRNKMEFHYKFEDCKWSSYTFIRNSWHRTKYKQT